MKLKDWLARFCIEHNLAPLTERQYGYSVNAFEKWLGREASIADLGKGLNSFLRDRQQQGSPFTTRSFRGALLAILMAAASIGLARPPRVVRRVRCHEIVPQHIRPEWFAALERAMSRSLYGGFQRAGLHVAYDSGLRLGNVLEATWGDVDESGVLRVRQRKSGRILIAQLRPETLRICRRLKRKSDNRLVPFPFGESAWHKYWRQTRKKAGVKIPRLGLQAVRRTGADRIARVAGVSAAVRYLGHSPRSGESVARTFYLSAEAQGHEPIQPPPIQ